MTESSNLILLSLITNSSNVATPPLLSLFAHQGVRNLCFEFLDLKDAVENLWGKTWTKYLAFLRLSEEGIEVEHELNKPRKHISAQGILVQEQLTGTCRELEEFTQAISESKEADESVKKVLNWRNSYQTEKKCIGGCFWKFAFLCVRLGEALKAIDNEEKKRFEIKGSIDDSSPEPSWYRSAENQLIENTEQPTITDIDLKKALSGLIKLGKGPLAHQLLLESYDSRLKENINRFLPNFPSYPETFPAALSDLVFSTISLMTTTLLQTLAITLIIH